MMQFSANLGFLWTEHSLIKAIHAAKAAGFQAVECHWPYETPAEEVLVALQETGLKMIGINTQRGNIQVGENGLAALLGRETDAHQFIDEAIEYARIIDCKNIHVMAGFTNRCEASQKIFANNIQYACVAASKHKITILIEPLNARDAPGYYLTTLEQAQAVLREVAEPNLKIMFDCYHMQIMGGDLLRRFTNALDDIGHVQFASVPDRSEPNLGEINYSWLLSALTKAGYDGVFGAEYKPQGKTGESIDWMKKFSKKSIGLVTV
tara:strand:- start:272 stop:1066 length:795 start_codon:yes stop_codon:yes gene_type:complete